MTDGELMVSRRINAPRAAVWRAWADPRLFEKWWLPEPMTCRVVKMDLRPGGGFETRMSQDGAAFEPHLEGCFLDIAAPERIVFTTVLKEGWRPIEPWLAMTAIITLREEREATTYVARAIHRTPADSRKHAEMGFHNGWGTVIDQLATLVEAH